MQDFFHPPYVYAWEIFQIDFPNHSGRTGLLWPHCGTHPATSLAMSSTSCQACHFTDLKSEGSINHSFLDILQAIGTWCLKKYFICPERCHSLTVGFPQSVCSRTHQNLGAGRPGLCQGDVQVRNSLQLVHQTITFASHTSAFQLRLLGQVGMSGEKFKPQGLGAISKRLTKSRLEHDQDGTRLLAN